MRRNTPHVIWLSEDETWSLAFFELPDCSEPELDALLKEMDDDEFLPFGFVTTGHPSIEAALIAARHETSLYGSPSPGCLNVRTNPQECRGHDDAAVEFREHN